MPLSWEEEVSLLQRELDRAWANLKLEEQRNRELPELEAAQTLSHEQRDEAVAGNPL